VVATFGVVALAAAAVIVRWPQVAAVPVVVLLAWISLTLFAKALALRRERRRRGEPPTRLAHTPSSRALGERQDDHDEGESGRLPPRARRS
jgi:hypothetical protein